jgi:hypothetical protein
MCISNVDTMAYLHAYVKPIIAFFILHQKMTVPFTDIDPLGVAGVFKEGEVVQLIQILRDVQGRAAA